MQLCFFRLRRSHRAMRLAAALLLAGSASAQGTLGPLSAAGSSISTTINSLKVSVKDQTTGVTTQFDFTFSDESVGSTGVYTYSVQVQPAPDTVAECTAVLGAVVNVIKNTPKAKGSTVQAFTAGCTPTVPVVVSRRAALLQVGVVTVTVTPPAPSAAPTTSSPTTAAPTTAAPSTAAPTHSCPDKYGAAVCAPFLAEGLCEEDLAMKWCRASCGKCDLCMFAEKKACKDRDDCKWGKKKKVCKTKKVKSCADLSKKKCKKADDCKWKKKACTTKKPCKLSKKACKKSDGCKWKNKKCKVKKAGRSASALSATSSEEQSSDSDESSESED